MAEEDDKAQVADAAAVSPAPSQRGVAAVPPALSQPGVAAVPPALSQPGVAAVPSAPSRRGVAQVPPQDNAMTGRIYLSGPDAQPPVFVDESGRRGRLLGLLGLGAALIGLALLVAFWWSQLAAAGG